MQVLKTFKAGDKGGQRYLRQWGEDLVAARYRAIEGSQECLTTI
jgi:hypothetical protein